MEGAAREAGSAPALPVELTPEAAALPSEQQS
jgi:hypothetical protein